MAEIRIGTRKDPREEYRGYSYAVQRYHRYDIYLNELPEDKAARHRYANECVRKQLIILAGMSEEEYEELQRSLANHVVQKKIETAKQYQYLKNLASESPDGKIYTYCVEEVTDDMTASLAVFDSHELGQAKDFARNAFLDLKHTVQLCEGLFDSEGNILGDTKLSFIVEVYGDDC